MTYGQALEFLQGHVEYLGSQALMTTPEGRAYHAKFKAAVEAVKDPHAAEWQALAAAAVQVAEVEAAGSSTVYDLVDAIDRLAEALMKDLE